LKNARSCWVFYRQAPGSPWVFEEQGNKLVRRNTATDEVPALSNIHVSSESHCIWIYLRFIIAPESRPSLERTTTEEASRQATRCASVTGRRSWPPAQTTRPTDRQMLTRWCGAKTFLVLVSHENDHLPRQARDTYQEKCQHLTKEAFPFRRRSTTCRAIRSSQRTSPPPPRA
jgi:hypothetical protein